jgi:hypothetical protein
MSTNARQTCSGSTPAARFEELGEQEIVDLILCRLEKLERAGCGSPDCLVLASRADLDLEQAVDLVARGCPPELALRILL